MTAYLEEEIGRRLTRKARFVDLGLFTDAELTRILTGSTACQPWLLYYSRDGGVGPIDFSATPERVERWVQALFIDDEPRARLAA